MYKDVFTDKHAELPASSLLKPVWAPLPCHGQFSISLSNWWAFPPGLRNHTIEQHVRSGQLAVGIIPLDCNNYKIMVSGFLSFMKMLTHTALTIGEVGGMEGTGVKWASHPN